MKKDILKGFLVTFIPGIIILTLSGYIIYNMRSELKNLVSQQSSKEEREDATKDDSQNTNNSNDNGNIDKTNNSNNQSSNKEGAEVVFQGKVIELRYSSDGSIVIQSDNNSQKYQVTNTEGIREGQIIWIRGVIQGSNSGITKVDTRELKIIK